MGNEPTDDPEGFESFAADWALLRECRPKQKAYVGERKKGGKCVVRVVEGDRSRRLPLVRRVRNHSSAFEWGYSGSGPAQLALAILCDYLGDTEKAERLHQRFKFLVIAGLPKEGWSLPDSVVQEALKKLEATENTGES